MRLIVIIRKKTAIVLIALFLLLSGTVAWQTSRGDLGEITVKVMSIITGKKLIPIYSVDTQEKKVAISFDAAWGADYTQEILDIMRRYNIKTTFFLVEFWVAKYPDMVKKIAAEGHEIGNHSATHPDFTTLSEGQIREELERTNQKIKEVSNQTPTLFRPPFGAYDNKVINVAQSCGFHVIQWSVDSLDWQDLTAEQIFQRVTKDIRPGDIVLFHNNGKNTTKALIPIIEKLQQDGYKIVPISELLIKGNYYVDHEGKQRAKAPATNN